MKFGPISFCSRSYCDGEFLRRNIRIHSHLALQLPFPLGPSITQTIPLDQPKSSRRQGTTAALQQLDVHVEIICYCQKQRSLRPICSVFCSKSFFHNSQTRSYSGKFWVEEHLKLKTSNLVVLGASCSLWRLVCFCIWRLDPFPELENLRKSPKVDSKDYG
uniref:Uncharacterized protein n=1 Tax=Cucumis sativus TaxID=3659 RepID=A0A0A0KS70_CUCSA